MSRTVLFDLDPVTRQQIMFLIIRGKSDLIPTTEMQVSQKMNKNATIRGKAADEDERGVEGGGSLCIIIVCFV